MPLSAPLLVAACMHAAERGVTRVNLGGLRGVCAGQSGGRLQRAVHCAVQAQSVPYALRAAAS